VKGNGRGNWLCRFPEGQESGLTQGRKSRTCLEIKEKSGKRTEGNWGKKITAG